ncbi:hypothetical protein ND861_09675 [Leptospira sp. 2 VSF19]|uniref:Uncharacterized protein n=1 Tax=Leptospira soteropolitanensis TaxID=2950025 RepID=A0AAW5VLP6_9LEPT|nr:hypothetical protein [Leptospira soteropolitanensis]MCW7492525.1 hypothetical protein [Leptospira soteropolitanensis]MCW7500573.1 hypothetical protein [Leptospira soteropolitanensis]MCW7522757.1 hypothetical protein [Leptospira soteropolitanensis]MCW7526613.1 hypothetical protein [Leptospira soteropolitanensis]MCW7530543.1 hypothetical protein [Leptospira soteropolitanensis]
MASPEGTQGRGTSVTLVRYAILFSISMKYINNSIKVKINREIQDLIVSLPENANIYIFEMLLTGGIINNGKFHNFNEKRDFVNYHPDDTIEILIKYLNYADKILEFYQEKEDWLNNSEIKYIDLFYLEHLFKSVFSNLYYKYIDIPLSFDEKLHYLPFDCSISDLISYKYISLLTTKWNTNSNKFKSIIQKYYDHSKYDVNIQRKTEAFTSKFNFRDLNEFKNYKEDQLCSLKRIIEILGFIPNGIEFNHPLQFSNKIAKLLIQNKVTEIDIQHFLSLETYNWFTSVEGSWFDALINSGVLIDAKRNTKIGTMVKAKDGHICRSISEKVIDDWFHDHGIIHEKEVKYPNSNFIADWKVDNYYIELFGLKGIPNYDLKILEKKEIAEKQGMNLVSIYLNDIPLLNEKFNFLLRNN